VTLDEGKATAIGMTTRFNADFAVFRLSGWTAGEYGVRRKDELPSGAEIAAVFTASARDPQTSAPARGQGDLF
jgi:hypothetical protein